MCRPINAHIEPCCGVGFKKDSTIRLFEDAVYEIIRHMDILNRCALGDWYTQ